VPGLRSLDLARAVVVPGFHDAHTHLSAGAPTLRWVDLRTATSAEQAARRVAAAARAAPRARWIRGFGWDETRWPERRRPARSDLDRVLPERPVLLSRADGHVAWLNTKALACLGWTEHTLDPEGGVIEREPGTRRPSGIALETAAELAAAQVPQPDDAERKEALAAALRLAAAAGITTVDDVLEPWALPLYDQLRRAGALTLRVHAWLPIAIPLPEAEELRRAHPPADPWIAAATLKAFLDGTLGSRTAALEAPYADAPEVQGELRVAPEQLQARMAAAATQGWAIALHAIGDRAIRLAADLLERMPPPESGRPHRVEHLQIARREDLARIVRTGAVASIQPLHYFDDQHFASQRLGPERTATAYPLRTLEALGATLAFGSDWPVAALDPIGTVLAAALRRAELDGPAAGEAIPLANALRAATETPALAHGDKRAGRIAPGYRADFVVLRDDLPELHAARIEPTRRILATYVNGVAVYQAPDFAPTGD
jgi:predicted amidohydrolase YtcJ